MVAPRTLLAALALSLALCAHGAGLALCLPTVNSVSPPKPQEVTGKLEAVEPKQAVAGAPVAPAPLASPASSGGGGPSVSSASSAAGVNALKPQAHPANNAEKLKRGLTNFMNQLNPAAYFVPPKPAKSAASAQAEPATIVNDGSSAEVVIKGPNRLVQARQLGGPLRWGRRR